MTTHRGHSSILSLGPVQGDRVQLMLGVHWLVSANERECDEISHSGVLSELLSPTCFSVQVSRARQPGFTIANYVIMDVCVSVSS